MFFCEELVQSQYTRSSDFYTESIGEDMSLVHESTCGWWKPRFLLDHRAKEANEFLNRNEYFVQFSQDDVDWASLRNVSAGAVDRARRGCATYPTHICKFQNVIARVLWQINPDGRYFMDEDGYGMTDDEEIELVGAIDRPCRAHSL